MKPSRDYSKMTREEAEAHFGARKKDIEAKVRELPTAEQFRLAADLYEGGFVGVAICVGRAATAKAKRELDEPDSWASHD